MCALQTSLSKGFSRQGWVAVSTAQGIFLDQGLEPMSPASRALQANSLPLSHQGSPFWVYHGLFFVPPQTGYFPQGLLVPFIGNYTWKPSLDGEFACSWDVLFSRSFQVTGNTVKP